MKIFGPLYDRVLKWAGSPSAPWYLGGLSFAESSFFPIPPDVMLVPMCLGAPAKAMRFALLTTLASVAGGIAGYFIGLYALEWAAPWMQEFGYWERYLQVQGIFARWGFWAVLVAGFSPIPYKVFTISAGALAMTFPLFVLASAVGRGARFFMVAGLVSWGGPKIEPVLLKYVERLGWVTVALLGIGLLVWKL
ncbi:MAG: DedA family protein [Gammaproteobacteria bacterium]|nr:DedA family protein [Gammaproteobacteria bacterium]